MNYSLTSLMKGVGDTGYSSPSFRRIIEDHLEWLRIHPLTETRFVKAIDAHKAQGDFNRLLHIMRIPADQWWIVMRLNGYANPIDYLGDEDNHRSGYGVDKLTLIVPSESVLKSLLMRHNQFMGVV